MLQHEYIIYQGQRVRVFIVNATIVARGEGMDWLLRDTAGRYYLRREIHDGSHGTIYARRTGLGRYRCFIHRVSVTGAVLWLVAFGADCTLRRQARRMLAPHAKSAPRSSTHLIRPNSISLLKNAHEKQSCCHRR